MNLLRTLPLRFPQDYPELIRQCEGLTLRDYGVALADLPGVAGRRGPLLAGGLRRARHRDPIGFAGGLNQYAYVGSNPVNWADPAAYCPSSNRWQFDGSTLLRRAY